MKHGGTDARGWVRATLRGYITALYTPYRDGEIDHASLRRNVERTLALPGVGGLSVNTLHQEFWTFTPAERERLVETVIETVAGRCPVVVGCSDPSARVAARFARHAQSAGADLIMLWPPAYGPRGPDGVRAYYSEIAGAVDLGILAYSTTLSELGYYLAPDQVAALLEIPNICGVQNTTLNVAQYAAMLRTVGDDIAVSTSLEEYFLFGKTVYPDQTPDFMIGSSRPIFCQSLAQPHCGTFFSAVMDGDTKVAAAALRKILSVADLLQSRYFAGGSHNVALFKTLAGVMGMETGGVRPPLQPPPPEEVRDCVLLLLREGLVGQDDVPKAWL